MIKKKSFQGEFFLVSPKLGDFVKALKIIGYGEVVFYYSFLKLKGGYKKYG